MDHRMRRTLNSFKCLLNNMLSCLSQYLNGHIIWDHILLNQRSHELVLGIGCCRESNLDLFKSDIY